MQILTTRWVGKYTGRLTYREVVEQRFGGDQLCAIIELKMPGVDLDIACEEWAAAAVTIRRAQLTEKERKRKEREWLAKHANQNDQFSYIAGYTPGGAPYGVR